MRPRGCTTLVRYTIARLTVSSSNTFRYFSVLPKAHRELDIRRKNDVKQIGGKSEFWLISKLLKTADSEHVLAELQNNADIIDVGHICAALQRCKKSRDVKTALRTLELMQQYNILPNAAVCSTMAALCNMTGRHQEAMDWALVKNPFCHGARVEPNPICINEAIRAAAGLHQAEYALELLKWAQRMEENTVVDSGHLGSKVWADKKTYTTVINAFSKVGRMSEAMNIFADMKRRTKALPTDLKQALLPDDVAYTALMQGWVDLVSEPAHKKSTTKC